MPNTIPCKVCHGRGIVDKYEENENHSITVHSVKCKECGGVGRLQLRAVGYDHPFHGMKEAHEARIKQLDADRTSLTDGLQRLRTENRALEVRNEELIQIIGKAMMILDGDDVDTEGVILLDLMLSERGKQ